MSRTEEMMSSTASDQTTMTRSSRWEMVSMGRLKGGVTHDKRCTLLLFSSAEIQDGMEDLDLVLRVDGKASVVGATGEGEGGVDWVIGREKEKEAETDSVARAA